jgi:hypothetical protein
MQFVTERPTGTRPAGFDYNYSLNDGPNYGPLQVYLYSQTALRST